jgi:hypothetical protein
MELKLIFRGKKALALSAYPVESAGNEAWDVQQNLPRHPLKIILKDGLSILIRLLHVAGNEGGMEYPGIVFCGWESKGEDVTDHEFGHNWFPMIVGSNERLFAWMDEGFNTFINSSSVDFNNGNTRQNRLIYTKELKL